MADFTRVDYGVQWNSAAPVPGTVCGFQAIPVIESVAAGVVALMRQFGHAEKFVWGNPDAWASDYEHPERASNGDSLNGIDDVHFMYFAGHGARELSVSLASNHFGCRAFYTNMRLGVKKLRWLVLDLCDAVTDPVNDSVPRVWFAPTDGDSAHPLRSLCVLCTFVGESFAGFDTNRGAEFATAVSRGTPVGTAWLDAAFARSGSQTNRPIAIACGMDAHDAQFRCDHGTLADRDLGPVPSNHLTWKWRG
ncbi:DUF6345 domain-containing protein [Streptomyces anulatus]